MATKYCDHGAYGAYAAVPTWGSAQDGDGTAKTIGTPSTAAVVFTGVPTAGVISVLGQTITFTRATDANTCANNLAAEINASTAVATGPASFTTLSQVRNHVYARGPANGAPAGTCEVITRQASAAHAGLIAITHTLDNVSSPATINFAGGTGGCWGYFINGDTAWAQAIAQGEYGLLCGIPSYTGARNPGDKVAVRSNKTIIVTGGTINYVLTLQAMGTALAPVVIEIDDGTEWPADGATPVFVVQRTHTAGAFSFNLDCTSTTFAHIKAKTYLSGIKSLRFLVYGTTPSISASMNFRYHAAVVLEDVELAAPGTTLETACFVTVGIDTRDTLAGRHTTYKNVRFVNPGAADKPVVSGNVGNYFQRIDFVGCEFVMTAPLLATPSFMNSNTFASNNERRYTFESCRFLGFVAGSRFLPAGQTSTAIHAAVFKNCDLGNMRLGPGLITSTAGEVGPGTRGIFASTQYGTRDFVMEQTGRLFAEWRANAGRPTLNARLNDEITAWSIFAVPSTAPANIGKTAPAALPRISKEIPSNVQLAQGVRTLVLEFLVESTISAWTKADVSLQVEYMGSDNVPRVFSTYDINAAALETSTAAWSATSWNGQTWLKRKITVVTPTAVLSGSEVAFYVQLHTAVANETIGVIVDPEITVS